MKPDRGDRLSITVRAKRSQSGHMSRAATFDLQHLKDGRAPSPGVRGNSGRPLLASQVVTAMRNRLSVDKRDRAKLWARSMSYFWHALDKVEDRDPLLKKVSGALDVPGRAWDAFTDYLDDDESVANKSPIYINCAEAITAACAALGAKISLPANSHDTRLPSQRRSVETPYAPKLNSAIIAVFQSERRRTQKRNEEAHRLADRSDIPLEAMLPNSERSFAKRKKLFSLENTLRFVRDEVLPWLPNPGEFEERYGFQSRLIGRPPDAMSAKLFEMKDPVTDVRRDSGSGLGLSALYRWFVPVQFDLVPFIAELVHITGFNLAPVLDIDRFNWYRGNPKSGSVTVYSRKARAFGAIVTVDCSTTDPNSPYAIIKSAIEITQPLHHFVETEFARLTASPKTPDTAREIDKLTTLRNRVWIGLGLKRIGVLGVDPENDPFHDIANEILRRREVKENGQPVRWSARRVRDGVAEDVHGSTNFSPAALQRKLQHKRVGQSAKYLEQPGIAGHQCRMIGERVSNLMDHPRTRVKHWPLRAEAEKTVTSDRPRTTILVMPGGEKWLRAAGPENPLARLIGTKTAGDQR